MKIGFFSVVNLLVFLILVVGCFWLLPMMIICWGMFDVELVSFFLPYLHRYVHRRDEETDPYRQKIPRDESGKTSD